MDHTMKIRLLVLALVALQGCKDATAPASTSSATPSGKPPPARGSGPGESANCELPIPKETKLIPGLDCTIEAAGPASDAGTGLELKITNRRSGAVTIGYYRPLTFDLQACVDGVKTGVTIPPWDHPVEPVNLEIPAAGTVKVPTAVSVRWQRESGGPVAPTLFTVHHEPAPTVLMALVQLVSNETLKCVGRVDYKPD
ncbi:MAG: hypothetical protein U0271_17240 [Polyangiaceae bacterium]